MGRTSVRRLIVILGDQLSLQSPALKGVDPHRDRLWMAEVREESDHVWSHKARIAFFLSAMRHFRDVLRRQGLPLTYHELGPNPSLTLGETLETDLRQLRPQQVVLAQPGDWRVLQQLREVARGVDVELALLEETHFLCGSDAFEAWAQRRKQPRLDHFYRHMRRQHAILMAGDKPVGGRWSFDVDNRRSFGAAGPPKTPPWPVFSPDALTREVLSVVARHFPDHPGSLETFAWPVTRENALACLGDFIRHRLPDFGPFQDAMWTDQPFLYHSGLSAALNVKLLSPGEVIAAALEAYRRGEAPLGSVEGFVRQILGWREYVRGMYWRHMPEYLEANELEATLPLPPFYWTGETDMACMRDALCQTFRYGYAHHIQRLMVTGLFALLLGVRPQALHQWYLAVYTDAVEWVELPNTLGLSQYADGGVIASKPYVASGRYIKRMSNYCSRCRYHPERALGSDACPFTTLYWDFLLRHKDRFGHQPRTAAQWRQLDRLNDRERRDIREQAGWVRGRVMRAARGAPCEGRGAEPEP